jgi:hypothetical protein
MGAAPVSRDIRRDQVVGVSLAEAGAIAAAFFAARVAAAFFAASARFGSFAFTALAAGFAAGFFAAAFLGRPSSERPSSREQPSSQPASWQRPSSERPSSRERPSSQPASWQRPSSREQPSSQPASWQQPSSERPSSRERPSSQRPSSQERPSWQPPSSEQPSSRERPSSPPASSPRRRGHARWRASWPCDGRRSPWPSPERAAWSRWCRWYRSFLFSSAPWRSRLWMVTYFAVASRRGGWQRQFTRPATHPAEESSARHLRFRRHQATAHAFLPQRPDLHGPDLGSSFLLDARPALRSASMLVTLALFAPTSSCKRIARQCARLQRYRNARVACQTHSAFARAFSCEMNRGRITCTNEKGRPIARTASAIQREESRISARFIGGTGRCSSPV